MYSFSILVISLHTRSVPLVADTVNFEAAAHGAFDVPCFDHLDCFGQSVLRGLLSNISRVLAEPSEWHTLGAGVRALEACAGVIGPDVSEIVCRISSFEDSVTQVIMTERIEPDPTAEEKRRVLSSLRPVIEQRECSAVNARTTLEDSETQRCGCIIILLMSNRRSRGYRRKKRP